MEPHSNKRNKRGKIKGILHFLMCLCWLYLASAFVKRFILILSQVSVCKKLVNLLLCYSVVKSHSVFSSPATNLSWCSGEACLIRALFILIWATPFHEGLHSSAPEAGGPPSLPSSPVATGTSLSAASELGSKTQDKVTQPESLPWKVQTVLHHNQCRFSALDPFTRQV